MSAPAAVDRATACAAALASLPDMPVSRLLAVLRGRAPEEAWDLVARGRPPGALHPRDGIDALAERWRAHAAAHPPEAVVAACAAVGVRPVLPADLPGADRLQGVQPAVPVLFAAGDLRALARPCVAVVGTRRATALGREVAAVLGGDLARAGVAVVSGLARGIDAAAHQGALAAAAGAAPPVAVVGTGPDVPYPTSNARLWASVVERGLLLSEYPPGTAAQAHHFPQRNRILAALARVVVVVESHRTGGALITADRAAELGRTVAVVPGSLRNPAAEGCNLLLRDGQVVPVLDSLDVLVAAGVTPPPAGRRDPSGGGPPLDAAAQLVLDHLGDGSSVDELVARTGVPLDEVLGALDRLDERGLARPAGANWEPELRSRGW